jgi:hypothetical protein
MTPDAESHDVSAVRRAGPLALAVGGALVAFGLTVGPRAQAPGVRTIPVPYGDARPILASIRRELLPQDLVVAADVEAAWPAWIAAHDAEVRARVLAGDDESVLNLLLFGTSFTPRPRATERELAQLPGTSRDTLVDGRIADLVAAASTPGDNQRLQFTRALLARHGIDLTRDDGPSRANRFLRDALARMAGDIAQIDRAVELARSLNQPGADALARATLFRERGLSTDTSILSSFALDRALDGLAATRTLREGSVGRVGIVGPGLDFVDKRDGFDFYPPQTIQPFAVVDSLARHRLLKAADFRVSTLDLNPRINDHVARLVERARAGTAYPLTLVRDLGLPWAPRLAAYWEAVGDQVATTTAAAPAPTGVNDVQVRALAVRPAVAAALEPRDVNIVTQRLEGLSAADRFDLIIATDILVYYDVFEQSLALANITAMLRPGGIFLSNTTLSELPVLPIGSIGFSDVVYLETPRLGDRVVWYQRK